MKYDSFTNCYGDNGKKCAFRLKHQGVPVKGFIDNDSTKAGKTTDYGQVISLGEYKAGNVDDSMIVICSTWEREIKYQLLDEGIFNYLSVDQIDFGGGENYYDEVYFEWQKPMGLFGAKISYRLFKPFVKKPMYL